VFISSFVRIAIQEVMKRIKSKSVGVRVYEPALVVDNFYSSRVIAELD
jgi:hypothetical protein